MVSIATVALLLVAGFCATGVHSAELAKIEDFPSIVQVETGYGRVWVQTCVGSILTSRHVLTAAHCLVGTNLTPVVSRVRAGASERGRDGEIFLVESIVRHPSYTFRSFDGNVGIIRLLSSLTFGSTIQQASIVSSGVTFPANVPVTVAGWGRTAQDGIWADRDLRSSQLFTVDHDGCVARYVSLPIPVTITENMICTSVTGADGTHFGLRDGGSPIYYNGVVIGFVSFGSPYGERFPLVATAISSYTSWIVDNAV